MIMKRLFLPVIASALLLAPCGEAAAYWWPAGPGYGAYWWPPPSPRYDAAYVGARQQQRYRGRLYDFRGPAYAFGDPAYGGCRLGRELVPTSWGPRWTRVRLCPAGSGRYVSPGYYRY
jgi:hypothetical protein